MSLQNPLKNMIVKTKIHYLDVNFVLYCEGVIWVFALKARLKEVTFPNPLS